MKKLLFNILFVLSATIHAFAQQGVFNAQNELMLIIDEQTISSPQGEVIFSAQGNIVFTGNSNQATDIIFKTNAASVFQEATANIFTQSGANANWYIAKGNFYYMQEKPEFIVINANKTDDYIAFYSGINDSLLAFISEPAAYSPAILFALTQILWQSHNLDKALSAKIEALKNQNAQQNNVQNQNTTQNQNVQVQNNKQKIASMEPVFGNAMPWLWDGKYLYPAFDRNPMLVWQFTNNVLRPRQLPRNHEEWRWDGDTLKPNWGGHPNREWTWRGGILRNVWNNNMNQEYIIDNNNIARPRFGNFGENEWQINGNIPLPVITAVLLGIVYR